MLFHLVRFSLFMLVVMLSFALAFYALFNTCGEGSEILSIYGTFGSSLLAMFEAMLGGKRKAAVCSRRPGYVPHVLAKPTLTLVGLLKTRYRCNIIFPFRHMLRW